jgi:hypothetical protein
MVRGYASPARQAGADQQEDAGADARQPCALCRCIAQPICCPGVCNLSSSAAAARHEDDIDFRRVAIGEVRDYAHAHLAGNEPAPLSNCDDTIAWHAADCRCEHLPWASEIHLLRTIEKQDADRPSHGSNPEI